MNTRGFLIGLAAVLVVHLAGVQISPYFSRAIDLFIVLTMLNALDGRTVSGMFGGFICGLCFDAFSGQPFGLYGFANTLAGYLTAVVVHRLITRHPLGLLAVMAVASTVQQASLVVLAWMAIPNPDLPQLPWLALRVTTSSLLGLLLYLLGRRIQRSREQRRLTRRSPIKLG